MKYYTKCGVGFYKKNTDANTIGYPIYEEKGVIQDEKCAQCPFIIDVKNEHDQSHKRYECEAGQEPPDQELAMINTDESELSPATFDYTSIDEDTAVFLQQKANNIVVTKMRSDIMIGKEFLEAHDRLANHKNGTFEKWVNSIGVSHKTARNYINRYEYILKNFQDISDAEAIQPSLLLAIASPSAPPELQQAVIDGDIKTHKEYKELLEKFKEQAEKTQEAEQKASVAEEKASALNKKLLEQRLKSIDPADFEDMAGQARLANDLLSKEKEKNNDLLTEVKDLRIQLTQKPIEAKAAEIEEVVPDDVSKYMLDTLYNEAYSICQLTPKQVEIIVAKISWEDAGMMHTLAVQAAGKLNEIIEMIEDYHAVK